MFCDHLTLFCLKYYILQYLEFIMIVYSKYQMARAVGVYQSTGTLSYSAIMESHSQSGFISRIR